MTKGKVVYTGSFIEFFFISLLLLLISVCTFGIAIPYYVYWTVKYFVDNLEIILYDKKD